MCAHISICLSIYLYIYMGQAGGLLWAVIQGLDDRAYMMLLQSVCSQRMSARFRLLQAEPEVPVF